MIQFILEKIRLRNVRCYGDEPMEMDFPLNNLTVFTGHVGAGKSTIVKAVSMALYGEDGGVKGEKLSIDDMINEKNGKNLEISLYFHSEDSLNPQVELDKYEIHLYHKHSMYGSKLVFMKNGQDISANGKLDTYRLIEKTLIPKQVYHNIYYFTQQAKNFFTALPNSEQKEIFDSILDLSEYDEYYENAKAIQDASQSNLESLTQKKTMYQDNILLLDDSITKMKEKLENDKKSDLFECSSIENSIIELNLKLSEVNKEIDKIGSEDSILSKKQKLSDEYNLSINEINSNIAKYENEKKTIQDTFKSKFEVLKNTFNCKLSQLQSEFNVHQQQYQSEKDHLESKKNSDIQTAKQLTEKNISDITLNANNQNLEFQSKLTELNNELNKILQDKKSKIDTINYNKNVKIQGEERSISDISHKIDLLDERIHSCHSEITKAKIKKNEYVQDKNNEKAVCRLCGQPLKSKEHIESHIKKLDEQISESQYQIDDYEKQKSGFSNLIIKVQNQIPEIENSAKTEIEKIESESKVLIDQINERIDVFEVSISDLVEQHQKAVDKLKSDLKDNIDYIESKYERDNQKLLDKYQVFEKEKDSKKNELSSQLLSLKNEIQTEYNLSVETISKELDELTKTKNELNSEYQKNNSTLETLLKLSKKHTEERSGINDKLIIANSKLTDLKNKVYDETSIHDIEDKKNKILESIHDVDKQIDEVTEDIEIATFWKNSFSNAGIKSMLIDSAIPHMNECVRNELDRVAPGVFTVSFDTLSQTKSGNVRDKFAINIVHNLKGSTGHKKLSGGEKRIVDLCCMTALRSLAENLYNKKFCHIFYDEILDSLDTECKEQFCRNAKLQSESGMNITLITHDLPEDVDPDRVFPF